jgi:hypothetical protein
MTRTYKVKEQIDGHSWKDFGIEIYASNWHGARKGFTEWIMGWLDEINADQEIEQFEAVSADYRKGEYLDTFRTDNKTYTIKRIN